MNSTPGIRAALAQSEPEGPSDEELRDLWSWSASQDQGPWPTQQHCFAHAILARWGRPTCQPIPVSERLPGPEDCCPNPRNGQRQWCWGWVPGDSAELFSGFWTMLPRRLVANEVLAWAPWWSFPLPDHHFCDATEKVGEGEP